MPDIPALIHYINERQIEEGGGSGYSFVKELPPNLKDTFFAMSCLKMLKAASHDRDIVRFLSGYDNFDFYGSLQNENGGFRRTPFGGISTMESCYLALSIIFD